MVNSYLLAKVMRYNDFSVTELARILCIDRDELKDRLIHGLFKSNELEIMLHIFNWPISPIEVFFSTYDQAKDSIPSVPS